MKVKVFSDSCLGQLEGDINSWLLVREANGGVDIVDIKFQFEPYKGSGGKVFIYAAMVLYKERANPT